MKAIINALKFLCESTLLSIFHATREGYSGS